MTRELLKEANNLSRAITNLEIQIKVAEDMHHSNNCLQVACEQAGMITIAWDDELKNGIIDTVLKCLNARHDVLEDKLRML